MTTLVGNVFTASRSLAGLDREAARWSLPRALGENGASVLFVVPTTSPWPHSLGRSCHRCHSCTCRLLLPAPQWWYGRVSHLTTFVLCRAVSIFMFWAPFKRGTDRIHARCEGPGWYSGPFFWRLL